MSVVITSSLKIDHQKQWRTQFGVICIVVIISEWSLNKIYVIYLPIFFMMYYWYSEIFFVPVKWS